MQADSARTNQIIDGRWVAVGTNKPHTIQLDYSRPFQGKPSYRFELKQEDNTLEGYAQGAVSYTHLKMACMRIPAGILTNLSNLPPDNV